MGDIAASDITVTILQLRKAADRNFYNLQLAFGNSTLTYPAGGIPVDMNKLGCPNIIESLTIYDKGTSGYLWSYDAANKKLVGFYSPAVAANTAAHSHNLKVIGGQGASTTNNIANYPTAILGKQEASDETFLGADSATKGGVVAAAALSISQAAGTFTQLSTVAIVATVLRVEIVGW